MREVLAEIGADTTVPPELLVVNKTDAPTGLARLRRAARRRVRLGAHRRGLDRLRSDGRTLDAPGTPIDVPVPYDRGDLVARMHEDGRVDATEHTEQGTRGQGPGARRVGRRAPPVRDVLGSAWVHASS